MADPHRLGATAPVTVHRVRSGRRTDQEQDLLTVEEPLEVRLIHSRGSDRVTQSVSITMRTPGHDFELAAGFLYAEGIIPDRDAIERIEYCRDPGIEPEDNIVNVVLHLGIEFEPERLLRHFYTTSSCGVCGKVSLDALHVRGCPALPPDGLRVPGELIHRLPDALKRAQELFHRTGGLHAAGLFDSSGALSTLREDVGRHNALDKLVGEQLLLGSVPLHDHILVLSGRASFELVQKALVAQIPIVVAVGAPSSLAVEMARDFGMTLVGFARGEAYNVYAGEERIAFLG